MSTNITADAIPTKQFFVSMLTRDISLADAILDLIDNCIDGALRDSKAGNVDYSKYTIDITINKQQFMIKDNCGGIPLDIAKKYAFKMGRDPDDKRDINNETIGMYGVGMKRAIFKMGQDSIVKTKNNNQYYEVPITQEWLNDTAWNPLPISLKNPTEFSAGTEITVNNLYSGVSKQFGNDAFINELIKSISEHFTSFLKNKLTININNQKVKEIDLVILVSENEKDPAPYIFEKQIDDVNVAITVGLNTGRIKTEDDENWDFEKNRSHATAGCTVFCNDRAVIVGDKSRVTGWGDNLPMYHGQFSVITAIIQFRSANANQLPITTTKRALDTSSEVWIEARNRLIAGLRIWINYTNKWKNNPRSDQSEFWKNSTPKPIDDVIKIVSKRDVTNKKDGSIEYDPASKKVLPKPASDKPSSRRIVFSKPLEEIKLISTYLFGNDENKPSDVGEECFDLILLEAKENDEE